MSLSVGIPGLSQLLGGAAAIAQPGPSQASRGNDYNPVTAINTSGGNPDWAGIAQLYNVINAGNAQNGGLLTVPIGADTYVASGGTNYNTILIYIGLAIAGLLIWRKFSH